MSPDPLTLHLVCFHPCLQARWFDPPDVCSQLLRHICVLRVRDVANHWDAVDLSDTAIEDAAALAAGVAAGVSAETIVQLAVSMAEMLAIAFDEQSQS
jgi:DNA-binding transcriptional LysR family regulator